MAGDGELAGLMRAHDWSQTPLGPVSCWPQSLRTAVSLILNSQHPMWIGWGPAATFLYNDAYIQVLSLAKHPWAMGKPAAQVWPEIWDICGPLVRKVFEKCEPSFLDDVRLFMNRGDYLEETYYSFSYSPILDESGKVGGLFCPSAEVTPKVLNARRLRTLSELSADAFLEKSVENACASAARTLARNLDDVPFALLYLLSPDGSEMLLEGRTGVPDGDWHSAFPFLAGDFSDGAVGGDGFIEEIHSGHSRVISVAHIDSLPLGPAQQKVTQAIVLPMKSRAEKKALGILIAGVNPTRKLDEEYRTFYNLVADHLATAVANARAYEQERKRSQALAELDKAKTLFFSNISHEFRTPLTLMLGPIESALARNEQSEQERHDIELLHRNALRLLKLVNTLLDFSRIEAGRVQAQFEALDLSAYTTELASVFGSAADRVGLSLRVDAPTLAEPVYVDREMWEKVILNLLSNAFKSTFQGEISVTVRSAGDAAEVAISDTGTGIPESEIPHLFERFRRIEGAPRRTNEGSGIGLALVHELVTMHGGSVEVQSVLGHGTTFTIRLPFGTAHLPKESALRSLRDNRTVPSNAAAYVQEALSGLPDGLSEIELAPESGLTSSLPAGSSSASTVLLVDDNHDMRDYVSRLLAQRFHVRTAENGKAALVSAIEAPPDLVLSDVMMPEMDGFQLLHALRSHPATSTVPVIMLSARAGEEARVEGLEAGADDYLVKPFTARELLARVESHLKMAQFRRQAMERELELERAIEHERGLAADALAHISDGFWIYDSTWRITYMNPAAESMSRRSREEQIGRTVWELFPDLVGSTLETHFRLAMTRREMVEFDWMYEPWQRWFRCRVYPTPDGGLAVYVRDSTEMRSIEQALVRAEQVAAAGKLAASISHEINNPLEAVTNLLFLAKSAPELGQETQNLLQVADGELQRLSHIARTSLKFFRQSTAPTTVQVQDLVESVLTVYQPRLTKAGVTLSRQFAEVPNLFCFPGELQQVFTNLVSNAIDALPEGGELSVSVKRSSGGSNQDYDGISVVITDSGLGMDSEVQSKLFQPFFTTKPNTGTGLGLWVTKGIVDKHQGTIDVVSSPGVGTTISLFFPHEGLASLAAKSQG